MPTPTNTKGREAMDLQCVQYIPSRAELHTCEDGAGDTSRARVFRDQPGEWLISYWDGERRRHIPFAAAAEAWRLLELRGAWQHHISDAARSWTDALTIRSNV